MRKPTITPSHINLKILLVLSLVPLSTLSSGILITPASKVIIGEGIPLLHDKTKLGNLAIIHSPPPNNDNHIAIRDYSDYRSSSSWSFTYLGESPTVKINQI